MENKMENVPYQDIQVLEFRFTSLAVSREFSNGKK